MMPVLAGAVAQGGVTCRYGSSRAIFRGPARNLAQPYVAFLGGSATCGKPAVQPYPDLVEAMTGCSAVNLAVPHSGPDFYLADAGALQVAAGAELAVVQIAGAEGLSNPFYSVHSRRNDRFLAATPALRDLFPEVDFADIHFTRHLLAVLAAIDPDRFRIVRQMLKTTWIARMQRLLDHLPQRRLMLWLADVLPGQAEDEVFGSTAPLFVDQTMLDQLVPGVTGLVVASARLEDGTAHLDVQGNRDVADLIAPRVQAMMR